MTFSVPSCKSFFQFTLWTKNELNFMSAFFNSIQLGRCLRQQFFSFSSYISLCSPQRQPALSRCFCSLLWDHGLRGRHYNVEEGRLCDPSSLAFSVWSNPSSIRYRDHLSTIMPDSVCLFPSKPNNTTAWISWLHIQRHTHTHWLHNCHQIHQPSYFQVSHRAFIASAALFTPCPSCLLTHSLLAMKSSDCPFIVGWL